MGQTFSEDYSDLTLWLTAVGEHTCEHHHIEPKEEQGDTIANTWLGFTCTGCGAWWRYVLSAAKAMPKPMRPYLTTTAQRLQLAERFNRESRALLLEMRNLGGWHQPDPGVAFMTLMAAATLPRGNPFVKKLQDMVAPKPKPD